MLFKRWMLVLGAGGLLWSISSLATADDSSDDQQDHANQRSSSKDDRSSSSSHNRSSTSKDKGQNKSSDDDQNSNRSDSGVQGFLDRHDRDNDGYLSRKELPQNMRSEFDKLDQNGDGRLSRTELQSHARETQQSSSTPVEVTYVWVLDADAGDLSLNDVQDAYDALQKIDKNNDGKISRQELKDRREQVAGQWCDKCFSRLDKNDDGELSRSEAQDSEFSDQFDDYDRNHNGSLTKSEIHRKLHDQFDSQSASRSSDENRR